MDLSLSPKARGDLKDLLICLSLGNLCFIRRWYDLDQQQSRAFDYYRADPPGLTLLWATLLASLLLSAVFALAWFWVKRRRTPARLKLAHTGFLLLLMFALESVRRYWNSQSGFDIGSNIALWAAEGILGSGIVLALRGNRRVVNSARRVTLILIFLLPSLLLDFFWTRLGTDSSAFQVKPSAAFLQHKPAHRVLWLLFDELDQRIAFEQRPSSVHLPELDRLRSQSFQATRSIRPGPFTMLAIPSLLSSATFVKSATLDARTVHLWTANSQEPVDWREEPNIFTSARKAGFNAGVDGWYHPYCRLFGDDLVRCFSVPAEALLPDRLLSDYGLIYTVKDLYARQARVLSEIVDPQPDSASVQRAATAAQKLQQKEYFEIRDHAFADAVDPRIDLLFVHFPTPHPFGIYDRKRQDFTLSRSVGYLDNLELVDRTLRELREKMEQAGLWDSTDVLVTADHGLRPKEWRDKPGWNSELDALTTGDVPATVPFILKLAGQRQLFTYDKEFASIVSPELVLAMVNGEVSTADEVSVWLDRRGAIAENSMR